MKFAVVVLDGQLSNSADYGYVQDKEGRGRGGRLEAIWKFWKHWTVIPIFGRE